MKPPRSRMLKTAAMLAACGVVFAPLSCVMRAGDFLGTGLAAGGLTGLFGLASPGALGVGAGINAINNVVHWIR